MTIYLSWVYDCICFIIYNNACIPQIRFVFLPAFKIKYKPFNLPCLLEVYVYMFYKAAVATSPVMSFDFRGP